MRPSRQVKLYIHLCSSGHDGYDERRGVSEGRHPERGFSSTALRIVSLGTSDCTAVAEIQFRRDDGSGKTANSALLRIARARSS